MRDGKLVMGQIGCGGFARDQDLPNFSARGDVVIKYCCDPDPEVDFLKVSTPHDMHKSIAIGGCRDAIHLVRDLKREKIDESDNGFVEGYPRSHRTR